MGGNTFETLSQQLPVLDQPHKIFPAQLFQTSDPWKMFVCIPTTSIDKGARMLDLDSCFQTTINSWYNTTKSLSISSSHSQTTSLRFVFHLSFHFFDSMFVFDIPCCTFSTRFLKITQSNNFILDSTPWIQLNTEVMVIHYHFLLVLPPEPERKARSILTDTQNATSG